MKLTLHTQSIPGDTKELLAMLDAKYILCVNNFAKFEGVATIGRIAIPQNQEPMPLDGMIRRGRDGAHELFSYVWPIVSMNPQVEYWILYNEPSIWQESVMAGFAAFNQRLTVMMHDRGKRIIVGCLSTGWPRYESEDGGRMMDVLAAACDGADGLSLHEYEPSAMWQSPGANCGRYRFVADYFQRKGYYLPPGFIGECGLDRMAPDCPDFGHCGWKTILDGNEDAYAEQFIWYNGLLEADDWIECAAMFTSGPEGWEDFEITRSLVSKIAIGDMPPIGGDMKYFDKNGVEMSELAFRQIYGNVQVERSTGNRYQATELWDSGLNAGMDCQVYVRGGYDVGAELLLMNGGVTIGSVKAPDMQEVSFYDCYAPPYTGPYSIAIRDANRNTDLISGLGWLCETSHRHVQKIVFEKVNENMTNQPPVAAFGVTINGLEVIMDGSESYDPDGKIVQYRWNPGDGTGLIWGKVKMHIYTAPGTYKITLRVKDDLGALDFTSKLVTVNEDNVAKAVILIQEAQALLDEALDLLI